MFTAQKTIQDKKTMTIETKNILGYLKPIEYEFYRDTYLCGVSINNKNKFITSVVKKVKTWTEKNGGKFVVLTDKIISHRLNKKGFIVQITFPISKGNMKMNMATLFE